MRWFTSVRLLSVGGAVALVGLGCTPEEQMGPPPMEEVVTPPGVGFPGLDGRVNALEVYDGRLYAAGRFLTAGGDSVFHIASWDGTRWSALGSGVIDDPNVVRGGAADLGEVTSLAVFDDQLAVAGRFDTAGDMPASNIAFWDGSTWSSLPFGGPNGQINDLTIFGDELVIAGQFTAVGGNNTRDVAAFDGAAWRAFRSGIGGVLPGNTEEVAAVAVYEGQLVAAGRFETASAAVALADTLANNVAVWQGDRWAPLQDGLDGAVLGLAVYDDRLYASGLFDEANGAWESSVAVDGHNAGQWVDMAIDRNDDLHVVYHDASARDARYAFYDGTSWTNELIDAAGDVGRYCSIVVADDGTPYVSYYENGPGDIKFAFKPGDTWLVETVRMNGDVGMWSSIALEPGGRVHIAYYHADSTRVLEVASQQGAGWSFDSPDIGVDINNQQPSSFDVGIAAEMVADHAGRLHIVYHDATKRSTRYVRSMGLDWTQPEYADYILQSGDQTAAYGRYLALALDAEGNPHALIHHFRGDGSGGGERLRYVVRDGPPPEDSPFDDWAAETVESPSSTSAKVGRHPSLVVDRDGVAHATYADATRGRLRYARRAAPNVWRRLSLDTGGSGEFSSIVLSEGRYPRVTYYDQTKDRLEFALVPRPSPIRRIACWDGTRWSELGAGLNWWGRTMVVSGGELLVGGAFTEAGGVAASRLASWNGSRWAPVVDGLDQAVWALAVFNGRLHAAGEFRRFGPYTANFIAKVEG